MPYSKTIVCLANSRKLNGRCVAGREWDGKAFGKWIRPVSSSQTGELASERYYKDGNDPKLLDIIEIPLIEPLPHGYQTENHVVNPRERWDNQGAITLGQLLPAVENIAGPLWLNGDSTSNGVNDKIAEAAAATLKNSLVLIQPARLTMTIDTEGADFGNPRRRVRGEFSLAGQRYVLGVTDPIIEKEFRAKSDGYSRVSNSPILCVSLSEIFEKQKACYKLIAGVIDT